MRRQDLLRRFARTSHFRGKSRIEAVLSKGLPRGICVVECNPYRFQMQLDFSNNFELQMFLHDCEPDTTWALNQILEESSVFWDVGANLGFYSLFAGAYKEVDSVVAFEPSSSTMSRLRENLRLNRDLPIRVQNVALGDRKESLPLFPHDSVNHGMNSIYGEGGEQISEFVRMTTADSLVSAGEARPDVIKVDVEGAEYAFLMGAQGLLNSHPPILLMEVSRPTLERAGQSPESLLSVLRDLNYCVFWPWRKNLYPVPDMTLPHEELHGEGHGGNYLFTPKVLSHL